MDWTDGKHVDIPQKKSDKDKGPYWSTVVVAGKKYVYIACPACGGGIVLTDHRVRPDGTLDASPNSSSVGCSVCPTSGVAAFHKTVRLLDWDDNILR